MMWRAISTSPCLEGIRVAQLNDPGKLNLYNDHSFLLSGYGDLYSFGGSQKKFSPNVSRSTGSRYGFLMVGLGRFCVPRHPPHLRPSFIQSINI